MQIVQLIHGAKWRRNICNLERSKKELNFNLKDEQCLAVKELMQGNDVLAVLPTGFGKSIIYQAFTSLKNTDTNRRALVLVISPLDSLIKDQLLKLKKPFMSPKPLPIYRRKN